MKTLQRILACLLLAALTALVLHAVLLVRTTTATVARIPAELDATRDALLIELRSARRDILNRADHQMDHLRTGLLDEAGRFRDAADRRVGDTLARADTALATAENVRRDFQPVIAAAQSTLRNADKTVIDLHPQLLGLIAASKITAGETAQTMRDFRGAVPGFLAQGQTIAGNVETATLGFSSVASNLNRLTKPKWYDRLIGYGLNGVVIYRNLNPVTSLTVKGAQLLTSRP